MPATSDAWGPSRSCVLLQPVDEVAPVFGLHDPLHWHLRAGNVVVRAEIEKPVDRALVPDDLRAVERVGIGVAGKRAGAAAEDAMKRRARLAGAIGLEAVADRAFALKLPLAVRHLAGRTQEGAVGGGHHGADLRRAHRPEVGGVLDPAHEKPRA